MATIAPIQIRTSCTYTPPIAATWTYITGNTVYAGDLIFAQTYTSSVANVWSWQDTVTFGNTVTKHVETPEETAIREAASARRVVACRRAEDLLMSMLTEQQREQYKAHRFFDLPVRGKLYRLKHQGRVQLVEKGLPTIAYCIHPSHDHNLPPEDVLLTQKLLLEANEAEFLKVANATRLVTDPMVELAA